MQDTLELKDRINCVCSKLVLVANCMSELVFADSSLKGLSLILRDIERELKCISNNLGRAVESQSR
jgi:hypothetical protein